MTARGATCRDVAWALALVALAFAASARADVGAQGDQIVNVATVSAAEVGTAVTSSASVVTIRIPTPATIELLQYAPATAGVQMEALVPGAFRSGAGAPFSTLPLPRLTGAATAIALPSNVPLLRSGQFHAGDPIFIRLTDLDQNMDRNVRETVFVTITDDVTGDAEVVRLTEDGPDTGVFVGYLPTARTAGAGQQYDGVLQAIEKSSLTARYVDPVDPGDVASARGAFDPSNRVFDSRTGKLVSGAEITVVDASTGLPATVYSDDGVTSFPSTVVSGKSATDGAGRVYAFGQGEFRFPFLKPGTYRYDVKPPAGYTAPSKVPDSALQAEPGAPYALSDPGSRGGAFPLNPGPLAHLDIPVDPTAVSLFVQKTAGATKVGVGDFLRYQIAVTNPDPANAAPGVKALDALPMGFRYKTGSAQLNGSPMPDPALSRDGRTLTFAMGDLAAATTATIQFAVQVGAGSAMGDVVNLASATCTACGASNLAQAKVSVGDDFFSARTFILGSVTAGSCEETERGEHAGIEGARVLLEDGTSVASDKQGLFHFEGVRKGLHVVQLDLDSLPEGYEAVACAPNDRFAGRSFSQFVEVGGDTLWRADFRVRERPKAAAPSPNPQSPAPVPPGSAIAPPPTPPGELALSLTHSLRGRLAVEFQAEMRGAGATLTAASLAVTLPEGLAYEPGSSVIGGAKAADPAIEGRTLTYPLGDLSAGWKRTLTFRSHVGEDSKQGDAPVTAVMSGTRADGSRVQTPSAENVLRVGTERHVEPLRMVIRPHFATFGVELSPDDKKELEQLARRLAGAHPQRIVVIGHTDWVRIAPRARKIFADNEALSLGRARSVGRFLGERLRLGGDQLELIGKGEREPIADNRLESGRALNRRVEVQAYAEGSKTRTALVSVKDRSGEESVAVPAPAGVVPAPPASGGGPEPAAATLPASVAAPGGTPSPAAVAPLVPLAAPALAIVARPGSGTSPGSAVAAPSVSAAPASPVPAAPPMQSQAGSRPPPPRAEMPEDGILSPADGDLLADRVSAVQVRIASYLTPELTVDGKTVDPGRIGYKAEDARSGKTTYTYVGVDFGAKGKHILTLTGTDPFGNARVKETAKLTRTGEIASIRLVSAEGNVADGRTPVRARIELLDASGDPIRGATRLELREGNLKALRRPGEKLTLDDQAGGRTVHVDKDGWVLFDPVATSGSHRAILSAGGVTVLVETWVQPKMRDWILVGLAEETAGYDIASGNMESLAAGESHENFYSNGRLAFYAKGQIQGKWLATMAYDNTRARSDVGNSLFQAIDPQTYFTLYGDAGQQSYDAPTARKLYVKIEREQFYALFGDYDTGLTVTELSRYSRKLNGVKAELSTRHAEVSAFAARTDEVYARDEIPGDGTSGLYRLSRAPITANSETVIILTRDRFRSEVILESRTLTRFTDYSIDYDRGTIFFREPIPSRDLQFNPITIVVEYEVQGLATEDYTLGGRAGLKLLDDRLRMGVTEVHEGQGSRQNDLIGADLKLQLGASTGLRGEVARTDQRGGGSSVTGDAFLAELTHNTREVGAKLYLREQEDGFGLGQQPLSERGTRKLGGEAAYHFSDQLSLSAQGYRQDTFAAASERLFGEMRLNYSSGPYAGYVGVLDASDRLADGTRHDSGQLTAGGKLRMSERLQLGIDYSQSVWGNGSADFPTRVALHAEYKLAAGVALLAAEELTWGGAAATQNTRLGLRFTPWTGGSLTSSVERNLNENAERVFGNIGLRQTWQLTEAWKVDAGAERSQTVRRVGSYQVNPNAPPASGSVSGEDFTALSTGANYQVRHLVWDSRAELRLAASEDKWSLITGAVLERGHGWAFSGRGQYMGTSAADGSHGTTGNLRFGLVYRPPETRWILLNRIDWIIERGNTTAAAAVASFGDFARTDSWRLVDNLLANYQPRKDWQVSMGYGGKYVREAIAGTTFQGYTDQDSLELRHDLSAHWDVGLRASALHAWSAGQVAFSAGPSVGVSPAKNLWLGLGFNVAGYDDRDFSASNYTAFGPYLRMRFKFDQQSVREAASWLNKQ